MAPVPVTINGYTGKEEVEGFSSRTEERNVFPSQTRNLNPQDHVRFDPSLASPNYQLKGTDPNSKLLFEDVNILDSTGSDPYMGSVFIEGERIKYVGTVPNLEDLKKDPEVRLIKGKGRTLMSGLGDAHVHFSWNNGDLGALGGLGVEEHTLLTARSALTYLDSGYTMCFGAASAKDRLDVVIRDAINEGRIPGPRYLANGKEIARRDGELVPGITAFADGPLEMREVIRHHVALGVDQIKLSMSGEAITETRDAEECFFTEEEIAACVDEGHRHGKRLCTHARSRDSVLWSVKYGVDIIYHASYIDEDGMDLLEKNKHKHVVAPGINWLYATLYEAEAFGYPNSKAEQVGYKKELEVAIRGLREMHRRGITVLPGGDYGFAWTPHGTYARDLEHFVKLLEFTPMEALISATAGMAKLFMREDELGKVQPGYFADLILVDGDPLHDITVLQEHDKLNVIVINGRVHKASYKEFIHADVASVTSSKPSKPVLSNFVAYKDQEQRFHVGHLDSSTSQITALTLASGAPIQNLYQVIEVGADAIKASSSDQVTLDSVSLLPPLPSRDVLCVGKNYAEHAIEFNKSGYDASDKVDQPSHPVIFTKRATSIVGSGADILPLPHFTQTLDYEGEVGVIIGKPGFRIEEKDAMDYVWGYTIINDVTARERQRDHKQFYLGKSPDTFCPMGPVAVPKEQLPSTLQVQTFVNGQKRQDGTTDDLIFSIPKLIATLSEGTTLRAGDVIATGTPAGVGFGLDPPTFLKPGDVVEVKVTGLGTLTNRVADAEAANYVTTQLNDTHLTTYNLDITCGGVGLREVNGKQLNVHESGTDSGEQVIYVHGLGGTSEYWQPLVSALDFDSSHKNIFFDLEGHGLSPTAAASILSIPSYAADLAAISPKPGLLIAHSMGCLIALSFAQSHPDLVKKLILVGPPPNPLPQAASANNIKRAAAVRAKGLSHSGVAQAVAQAGTSKKTKASNPVALSAVRQFLLSQDPEGYAKGCTALAGAVDELPLDKVRCPVLIVTGDEDGVCPPKNAEAYRGRLRDCKVVVLDGVGHWHVTEDVQGVAGAVREFLQ